MATRNQIEEDLRREWREKDEAYKKELARLKQKYQENLNQEVRVSEGREQKILGYCKELRAQLQEHEKRHNIVWHEIFRDYKWLDRMIDSGYNPILVGIDLYLLYNADVYNADEEVVPIYLVLLCRGTKLQRGNDKSLHYGARITTATLLCGESSVGGGRNRVPSQEYKTFNWR
jgi:hypothetical protein